MRSQGSVKDARGPIEVGSRPCAALVLVVCACGPSPMSRPAAGPRSVEGAPRPVEEPLRYLGSEPVKWTCTGSPCPWGASVDGNAVVWPAAAKPIGKRLGYSVSAAIYLPASAANGTTITLGTGSATAHAGLLDAPSHRVLTTLSAGHSYQFKGLTPGEVVSVQSSSPFTYATTPPRTGDLEPAAAPGAPGDVTWAVPAVWRCVVPGCTRPDWTGAVIPWPSWSAYQGNARMGDQGRDVYSVRGEPLYPYMGLWADGCVVTARSGIVVVIEWQRGNERWRRTRLQPGQTHVIALRPGEDGAMIETEEGAPAFSVSLQNCVPRPLH